MSPSNPPPAAYIDVNKLRTNRTYFILHPASDPATICACGGCTYHPPPSHYHGISNTAPTPGSFRKTLYGGSSAPNFLRMPLPRDPTTDRASIRAIFTHPAYARRGLGTLMMRHCEAAARAGKPGVIAGFERLEMGATLSGVALYEKCGYSRSGRVDVVECPNGEGIKVVHMTKDLL
jgi:GNAT superfamily N-acetyltransferase